jgi:hypothetical protein
MRHSAAKRILDDFCRAATSKSASSGKVRHKEPNPDGARSDWWLDKQGKYPSADSPRTMAYLAAYLEIGEERFYGTGIRLDDGYMYPDRAVMKALLRGRYVELHEARHSLFVITERGRELIHDVAPPSQ